MTEFFQFEADFANSLRCIPMQVRFKLDNCGVKLKLQHWYQFSPTERQQLVASPCTSPSERTAYREHLQALVKQHTGEFAKELAVEPQPPWFDDRVLPETVQAKARDAGVEISLAQWAALDPLQRFALIKLSRPSHENRNFTPALREFQLA